MRFRGVEFIEGRRAHGLIAARVTHMTLKPQDIARIAPAAVRRRSQLVRGRLGRRLVAFGVAGIGLCALVVWQRDARQIEAARAEMDSAVIPLVQHLRERGELPVEYPVVTGTISPVETGALRYADADIVRWAPSADRPVVIGHGRVQGLIARPNGYAVIIYDRGSLRVEWAAGDRLGPMLDEQRLLAAGRNSTRSR